MRRLLIQHLLLYLLLGTIDQLLRTILVGEMVTRRQKTTAYSDGEMLI
jgi:hypothetical protein